MQITHLGHACLLLEVADQRILVDPGNFSDAAYAGLADLTAVVITHLHRDHYDPDRLPGLLQDHPQAVVLAEPQTAEQLTEAGLAGRTERMVSGERITLGDGSAGLTPVGERHAFIHPYVPQVGNLGVVVRAEGEPVLYHPGDALDAEPGEVDLLAVPVSAPWARVADTIEFVRRVQPRTGVIPIHDALLSPAGRGMYLQHIGDFGAEGGVKVLDLKDQGPTDC